MAAKPDSPAAELRHMLREDPTQLRLRVDKLIEQARTQETKDFWRAFGRFLDVAVNRTK